MLFRKNRTRNKIYKILNALPLAPINDSDILIHFVGLRSKEYKLGAVFDELKWMTELGFLKKDVDPTGNCFFYSLTFKGLWDSYVQLTLSEHY